MRLLPITQWAKGHPWRRRLVLGLMFLIAFSLLGMGIGEHTGVTGKDEYYLSLRTPMCMLEQDKWLVPCLDGMPRLNKPPMLYWLTAASYKAFGISLDSARLVSLLMASLLVLGVTLIALELGSGLSRALLAGLVSLSFGSLSVGARILELDVPVATFSTLAFYCLLRWYRRNEFWSLMLASVFLAAGFLTKGPVVFVICGGGGLALLTLEPGARKFLTEHGSSAVAALFLFAAIAIPWFIYVNHLYPEYAARTLTTELVARDFFKLSLVPVYGTLLLALPWSFIALVNMFPSEGLSRPQRRQPQMLLLWLLLTLLPFFFIKTFERYLYGSLVPLALIIALPPTIWGKGLRWAGRIGMALMLMVALPVSIAAYWIADDLLLMLLGIFLLSWFVFNWWRASFQLNMLLSAVLLSTYLIGVAYPKLGVNRVPMHILQLSRERDIVLYHGPQPAMLPALLGRSLVHVDDHWRLPERLEPFLLFVEAEHVDSALLGLKKLGLTATEQERFGVLSSRVRWANMVRRGQNAEQLFEAVKQRDLEAIKPQVVVFEVEKPDRNQRTF